MPGYFNFPLPLAFLNKNIERNPLFAALTPIKFIPYDMSRIESILTDAVTRKEINRIFLKFGNEDKKGQIFGEADDSPDVIFKLVQAATARYNMQLTMEQIKVIYALHCSIGGEIQQGGIFRTLDVLCNHLFATIDIPVFEDEKSNKMRVQIDKQDEHLLATYQVKINKVAKYTPPSHLFFPNKTLLKKNISFVITTLSSENNLYFNLVSQEKLNDCMIDKDLLEIGMVPAALTMLEKIKEFKAEDFILVPLLINEKFRNEFCKKLRSQKVEIKKLAIEFIEACFSNDLDMKNVLMAKREIQQAVIDKGRREEVVKAPPPVVSAPAEIKIEAVTQNQVAPVIEVTAEEKVTPTAPPKNIQDVLSGEFTSAVAELTLISQTHTIPQDQRDAAQAVIAAIKALSPKEKAKNSILLTDILQRTAGAITDPADTKNLQQYRALMLPVRNKNWCQLASGMGLVLLGVAVAAISIAVALASFGATSVFSSWGIALGTSVMTQAISITGAALGLSAIPGGAIVAHHRPLKKVITAASFFWQPEKGIKLHEAKAPEDNLKPHTLSVAI
jgi:hypothetical protein